MDETDQPWGTEATLSDAIHSSGLDGFLIESNDHRHCEMTTIDSMGDGSEKKEKLNRQWWRRRILPDAHWFWCERYSIMTQMEPRRETTRRGGWFEPEFEEVDLKEADDWLSSSRVRCGAWQRRLGFGADRFAEG
jgi:hypothetical protein